MYEAHFGLQEAPFALTPNTRYFVRAPGHSDALELLLVALREREGFIKITGEVGTGKTLLCRLLLNALDEKATTTAYLPNPGLTPASLYEAVADELGVPVAQKNPHRLLNAISQRLIGLVEAGQSVVLVIDEAGFLEVLREHHLWQ
jgi:MSHA biogenesis protein MshM